MGASLMNESAKLHLIFGVPLSLVGRCPVEHQIEREIGDEEGEALELAFVRGVRPGLMHLGNPNDSSMVFGIPVKTIDLHTHSHHMDHPTLSAKQLTQLKKQYAKLWADLPSRVRSVIRKLNSGQPKAILVLDVQ